MIKPKIHRVTRNAGCESVSLSSRCLQLENRELLHKTGFGCFPNFLRLPSSPRISLFFLKKYFHDDTPAFSWCPGKTCVNARLLNPNWSLQSAQPELIWKQFVLHPPPGLFASIRSHLDGNLGFLLHSVMQMEKGNALPPLPKTVKRAEKPTFHPVAFRSCSYFAKLSHFKQMMSFYFTCTHNCCAVGHKWTSVGNRLHSNNHIIFT